MPTSFSTNAAWIRWPTCCRAATTASCIRASASVPRCCRRTLLPEDHEILEKGRAGPNLLEIPLEAFTPYGGPRPKAKGPHQITHGDIARACGYCDSIRHYQTPAERWMKTYEDRAFRWLIGTHGTPLEIPNVCQIRHIVKGRYKQDSFVTRIRKFIRKSQDR
jgi:hypothetical protein